MKVSKMESKNLNKTKRLSWPLLGLLIFVSASGASAIDYGLRNIKTIDESLKVTCLPQGESSAQLWTCQDIYGNQFTDLKIIKHSEASK
jgi:hypothetical protein